MKFQIGDKVKVVNIVDSCDYLYHLIKKTGTIVNFEKADGYFSEIYIIEIDGIFNPDCGEIDGERCFGFALWPEELEAVKA
jgi:hypothetical protein